LWYGVRDMDLIIETDVGHDPDDVFAICYLASAGVNIRAIVISPGDRDQIAMARLICKLYRLDIPIGYSKQSEKFSSGGMHYHLLDHYGYPKSAEGDGFGKDIMKDVMNKYDCEFFIIGPPNNTGKYLKEGGKPPKRLTMHGGFLPYNIYSPTERIDKFEDKNYVPTFNMNGDRPGTKAILEANIPERRFCGKNVCHTVLFTWEMWSSFAKKQELFDRGTGYLLGHKAGKKFHDPVAAVCHLHPEVGTWVKGKPTTIKEGWGTIPDENGDYILADLDRDAFWKTLGEFK
jgi:inosine-uridine nucleoside N-ribohydrolase